VAAIEITLESIRVAMQARIKEWSSLMNRFVTLLALAIGVSGPASAGIINPYGDPDLNANVVAGQISGSGVRERGVGFRVQRTSGGYYEITFNKRFFPSGCAALVVTPDAPVTPVVMQSQCGAPFYVSFYLGNKLAGADFQFIAREDAPQHS
jgi:hypothetical protein